MKQRSIPFLTGPQRDFGPFVILDLGTRAIPLDDLPVGVAATDLLRTMPALFAVDPPNEKLHQPRNTGLENSRPVPQRDGQIVRMNDLLPRPACQLLQLHAGILGRAGVEMHKAAIRSRNPCNLRIGSASSRNRRSLFSSS